MGAACMEMVPGRNEFPGWQGIVAGSLLAFFLLQLDLPGNTRSLLFPSNALKNNPLFDRTFLCGFDVVPERFVSCRYFSTI